MSQPQNDDTVGAPFIWLLNSGPCLMRPTCVDLGELKDRAKEMAAEWIEKHGEGLAPEGFPRQYMSNVCDYVESVVETGKASYDEDGNIWVETHDETGGYAYGFAVRPTWFF